MELMTKYGTYRDCFLKVGAYVADNSPTVEVWNHEDGPIVRLTVCVFEGAGDGTGFVDVNNAPYALDFIREYGLGVETGVKVRSGYCVYPQVKFDMDALRSYEQGTRPAP